MYEKKTNQISFDKNSNIFIDTRLSQENRCVKLAKIVPWSRLGGRYHRHFTNPKVGNPAKSCRMAIGSLIIKERVMLSDIETVELIRENPYMQFYIVMDNFTDYTPFDTSTMTYFRKRLTSGILTEINQLIVEANKDDDDRHDDNARGDAGTPDEGKPESKNEGTMILNATFVPADIHLGTDVILLYDSRVTLEVMIDDLQAGSDAKKPRTYRQKAQAPYLKFARNRRPCYKWYDCYPERILADKIYRNHKNHQYCVGLGIRMNGPNPVQPPKDNKL